nr:hypothetical protein [Rhodothermaceae bacterium]
MKKIIKFLLSKECIFSLPVVAGLAGLLGVMRLYMGQFNSDASEAKIIVILAGVLFVLGFFGWILWLGSQRKKRKKKNAETAQRLVEQTKIDTANLKPELRAEYEGLSKSFSEGVEYLKGRDVGLNELPWFLVIGPPGHGKTTLIRESGIDFAGFKTQADYKDPTKNCGWFISDKAIFVDTAGKYAAGDQAESSKGEWERLLGLIKESRPDRPINGIIIAISITAFKGVGSQPQIKEYARSLRERVHNVMEHLGVRVPIYITITMADVISGFDQYFEGILKGERDHWWGATLDPNTASPPGMISDFNAAKLFDGAFHQFYEHLLNRRVQMLSRHQDRDARHAAALFLKNLSDIRENIRFFIDRLFYTIKTEEDLLFRGFYLTSGTQTERPAVDLTSNLSDILGLTDNKALYPPGEDRVEYPEKYGAQSYFVKDFFTDIVIQDENIVELTSKEARKRKKLSGVSLIGSGAVTLLCSMLFIASCSQSRLHVNQYGNSAGELRQVSTNFSGTSSLEKRSEVLRDGYPLLKESHYRIDSLKTRVPSLGIYQADDAFQEVRLQRYNIVHQLLEKHYQDVLPGIVEQIANTRNVSEVGTEELLGLRAYTLLGDSLAYKDQFGRKDKSDEFPEHKALAEYAQQVMTASMCTIDEEISVCTDEQNQIIEALVSDFVDHQSTRPAPFDNNDDPNIEAAFTNLGQDVGPETVYKDFIAELSRLVYDEKRWRTITASDLLEVERRSNEISRLFDGSASMSSAFADIAWKERANVLSEIVERKLGNEGDWFDKRQLNESIRNLPDGDIEAKVKEYTEELMPRYIRTFYQQWEQFIEDIKLVDFDDLDEAHEQLKLLSEPPPAESEDLISRLVPDPVDRLINGEGNPMPYPFYTLFEVIRSHTRDFN